jgi:SurA N-terminal domain
VLRRVLTCAVGLGVLAAAAACSPVKMGAAATVGSQRITITQLDNQVASYNPVYQKYAGQVQLTSAQVPAAVLSWLIRFQIREQMALDAGVTVTAADTQSAISALQAQVQQYAAQSGQPYTLQMLMVANGIPPDLENELGRYQAIEIAWLKNHYGGSLPTTTSGQSAATAALNHAQCVTAKNLSIAVNPQFGRLNYSSYSVVATPDLLSKASGASSSSSSAGASPSC